MCSRALRATFCSAVAYLDIPDAHTTIHPGGAEFGAVALPSGNHRYLAEKEGKAQRGSCEAVLKVGSKLAQGVSYMVPMGTLVPTATFPSARVFSVNRLGQLGFAQQSFRLAVWIFANVAELPPQHKEVLRTPV